MWGTFQRHLFYQTFATRFSGHTLFLSFAAEPRVETQTNIIVVTPRKINMEPHGRGKMEHHLPSHHFQGPAVNLPGVFSHMNWWLIVVTACPANFSIRVFFQYV